LYYSNHAAFDSISILLRACEIVVAEDVTIENAIEGIDDFFIDGFRK
jgi:hypothetical protein